MATQAWQAERDKLMAGDPNLSLIEATKKARTAQTGIVNAPVAGVAPVVTPTEPVPPTATPVNVNEQQMIDNQTKRQEMIAQGKVPAVGQQKVSSIPLTPTQGVTSNNQGAVGGIDYNEKETTAGGGARFKNIAGFNDKGEAIDKNGNIVGTLGLDGKIISNQTKLATSSKQIQEPVTPTVNEEIKAKNEAQMALNKQQAELRTQERQQIAKEQPVPSQDQIFNSLKQGVPVGDPKSLDFRQAQARVNTFKKFSAYDTASLATSLSSGDLLVGTKAYNDLVSDPNMAIKIQKAMAFNKGEVDLVKTGETQMANLLAQNPTVATVLSDGYMSKEEYDQLTNNDEVSAQGKLVEEKKTKYETIKAQYDAVEDDVNTEFEGKEVTDSFKAKIVADRRKGMYKDYQIASLEYQNSLGTYTNLKADATALLAQNMELYKEQKAQEAEIAKEQRAIDNSLALSQMQFDQKIAQQTQMMNDPTTAISTMIEEYKKLGIPFTRSTQQIIQDFESSGQDLGTYLTELQKLVQEKPEYKRMQAIQQGQMSDAEKLGASQAFDLKKMGMEQNFQMALTQAKTVTQNKWTKLDDGLYTNENGEIITADELKSAKLMGNNYITKQVGEEGGDCGFYASRGTGMSSTPGGNSKDARIQAFSDPTPQVGGMALFTGSGYDQTYGHIAIVTGVNPDGTVNVKESNYGNDKRVTERTVPASSVTGYYNKTPLAQGAQGTQATGKQYSDSEIELFADIAAQDGSVQNTSLKNSGLTRQQLADYKAAAAAGKIPPTEGQKQAAIGILSNIQGIASTDWTDAVGKYDYSRGMGLQDASDTSVLIENLRDAAAFNNLGMIKGPMSDKDIAFLKSVSSKLDPIQSNKQFEKNIVEMYNIAARKAGIKEITKLSDIPKERITPGQVQPQENTGGGQTFQGYTLKPFN